jgi:HPt (histidine-containing phosphotransfer) domain-containing protein
MSGMAEVYVDTVKLTARLLPERIEKMDRFINNDIKSFAIEVHGLKSALKNIGASALGNGAAKLERAAIENDIAYCTGNYPPFRIGLTELKNSLNEAIVAEPAEVKEALDISSLAQALTEAKAAAENYDEDLALQALKPCANYTYGLETDDLLQGIIHALETFEFEKAIEMINIMEGNLNADSR